ncbi:iron-sulfur cluster assembly scaffold protein [Mycoplasma nasistruthionis]|uniref:Iron-sulfur cluster assembly scaffold protein n=1 Tax=Mycoplasma nasistruthionis TaxID=353852 RepID=A0A4Y6I5H7_9MOLU|nr:iron-sulfur cluster assembly scaffold protein [Mycoplasma nasistruthionis]QCZ36568.1 iron-sulfur cluster assembly scaffold protein [Mycoplasma nasistruthionis]QDF64866.1 iron-sulfur cluster assembly scaffold protein [Mycoplasma nasistruthionis]
MHFNPNEARELIMNHYSKPQNKTTLESDFETFFSTTCSDKLMLKATWKDNVLQDVSFDGHGCAIFMGATDIFLNIIKGKTQQEINDLAMLFDRFVNLKELSDSEIQSLGDLWVFFNVKKHLNRVNCALLTPNALKK